MVARYSMGNSLASWTVTPRRFVVIGPCKQVRSQVSPNPPEVTSRQVDAVFFLHEPK
jgi:hypothetical protein